MRHDNNTETSLFLHLPFLISKYSQQISNYITNKRENGKVIVEIVGRI